MSRTLRIEYPGAVYHVQSEGNRGDAIYLDDEDRETFLRTFQEAARRSGWTVYAYALMANHYHILFQTARANLVDGMKWLQTAYTQRFNARHRMRATCLRAGTTPWWWKRKTPTIFPPSSTISI